MTAAPQSMSPPINILLVDDQPAKLLSYEAILRDLEVNLYKAGTADEALQCLLKVDVAVILMDVCMPELDGFQLAAMIREHPRFRDTAIIFISAIQISESDWLKGYELGGVDYVSVPVVAEVLRAKIRVFTDLYKKTRELELLNAGLEQRVAERTADLEQSSHQLMETERRRSLALAAAKMGSWDWDLINAQSNWDAGQRKIFGIEDENVVITRSLLRKLIMPSDWGVVRQGLRDVRANGSAQNIEFRICRPDGDERWVQCTALATFNADERLIRISGVTVDITDRKEAEQRQTLLAREVDHRARNTLAVMQSIIRLTRGADFDSYVNAVEGRIQALSRAHTLLSESRWQGADISRLIQEELAPYRTNDSRRITFSGPDMALEPATAQSIGLALHELATNAAKYGALSTPAGQLKIEWQPCEEGMELSWTETGGPPVSEPRSKGFGTKAITASVERQLGGRVTFDWRTGGLHCTIRIALAEKRRPISPAIIPVSRPIVPQTIMGHSILVLEDEPLVAASLRERLEEIGFDVVGPFSGCEQALRGLQEQTVDAAILDINLTQGSSYPVADLLMQQGVPFVFVTGYGSESIEPRFRSVPTFQKPLERHVLEQIFRREKVAV